MRPLTLFKSAGRREGSFVAGLSRVDDLVNSITMYRLVLIGLAGLAVWALVLSLFGGIEFAFTGLVASLAVVMCVGLAVSAALAKLHGIAVNYESSLISILILFFIFQVASDLRGYLALAIAISVAMASKFVIKWRGAHIFNPVAIGVVVAGLTGLGSAGAWIVSPATLPIILGLGLLILRKTRSFGMYFVFVAATLLSVYINGALGFVVDQPGLVFFGMIMFTEPLTAPNTRRWQLVYGAFVGALAGIGTGFLASDYLALCLGNVLAFLVSSRAGTKLKLVSKTQLARDQYDFGFLPDRKPRFVPGQYMELTLPGVKFNSRGNRRTFTVAAHPDQDVIHFGVKFYQPSSKFKQRLLSLEPGETVTGGHVAGNFVLPDDEGQRLVFVAGGIGITPFVAMGEHLVQTRSTRDIVLFYFVPDELDLAYAGTIEAAKEFGLTLVEMVGTGVRLDEGILRSHVPDFMDREYYLSGPPGMVRDYRRAVKRLGIKRIHTDYFAGY